VNTLWLIIAFVATAIASTLFFSLKSYRNKYKLGLLSLMMLGTFVMVLVDRLLAFFEGEPLIEMTTSGLIGSGANLGIAMLIPILVFWLIMVYTPLGNMIKID
jgi:hypothetical protein